MPTALEVHSSLRDFLAGRDPGVAYRAGPDDRDHNGNRFRLRYDGFNIVGNSSGGSQNYGPMAGSNAVVYHYHRQNWSEVDKILDAWAVYATLNWLTNEVYSCNIYRAFITLGVLAAANVAEKRGRHALAADLRKHPRTGAVLTALASGWRPNNKKFGGYPCLVCGGRSFSGRIMYELSGNTFGSAEVAYWTGMDQPPEKAMEFAIQKFAKKQNIWGATTHERDTLSNIIRNRLTPTRLADCVKWLRDGPGFAADAAVIRTDEMVAFVTFNSKNVGSTNWLPGKAWYANGAPKKANRWGIPPDSGVCTVDFPGRIWGGQVAGEILDGYTLYRAQRITVNKKRIGVYEPFSWYNELLPEGQRHISGWAEMPLKGNLLLDLRVGKAGVSVVYPDGEPPPPPPPPDKIDMLEVMAPKGANFTKVNNQGTGRIATIRDDENRVFVVVKGAHGTSWDWFYWDDDYIYHVITEGGEKGDPTAFKSHVPPGVIWCKRFATLGESHVSSRLIWLWANCEQVSQHSLQAAKTTLHDRSYTAAQLGMESDDLPGSTVCYRINWQWGEGIDHLETFTYAVGWGFLDWEYAPYPTLPNNQRSTKPVPPAEFPCFDVPQWIDENFRPSPPPPPPPPPTGWYTIFTDRAYLKFDKETARIALDEINAGKNHLTITQVALEPAELAKVKAELTAIVGG